MPRAGQRRIYLVLFLGNRFGRASLGPGGGRRCLSRTALDVNARYRALAAVLTAAGVRYARIVCCLAPARARTCAR